MSSAFSKYQSQKNREPLLIWDKIICICQKLVLHNQPLTDDSLLLNQILFLQEEQCIGLR
jgi:hypothetical protein